MNGKRILAEHDINHIIEMSHRFRVYHKTLIALDDEYEQKKTELEAIRQRREVIRKMKWQCSRVKVAKAMGISRHVIDNLMGGWTYPEYDASNILSQ